MPWHRKEIRIANRRAELLIDSRFRDQAPISDLPEIFWIGVWCRLPVSRERFVPLEEEPTLLTLERKLIGIAGRKSNGWAVYLMRVLSHGLLEYYFYARDGSTLAGVADELKQSFPDYRLEQESKPDADWVEYKKNLEGIQ